MTIKSIQHHQIGLQRFTPTEESKKQRRKVSFFDLSSHARAKNAIEFALKMRLGGFHVFVVGEDRSGRMTATLEYLHQYARQLDPPKDWVYVNNFSEKNRPIPYSLPPGMGQQLKDSLKDLISNIIILFHKTFANPQYLGQVEKLSIQLQQEIQKQVDSLQTFAHQKGYEIAQTEEGFTIIHSDHNTPLDFSELLKDDVSSIREKLSNLTTTSYLVGRQLEQELVKIKRTVAEQILPPLFAPVRHQFNNFTSSWIDKLYDDILEHIDQFIESKHEEDSDKFQQLKDRYAVNILVNNRSNHHPRVILETNPTYESLFGSIKYASTPGGYETNFTMIRPGSLHLANGGILVLRADAIAKDPELWDALKGTIRDRHIHIHERYRENSMPLLEAPEPKSIPLDVQVFIVGSPHLYYNFFFGDADFRTYFKVKAEIDPTMPASDENVSIYRQLIEQTCLAVTGFPIDDEGRDFLTSYSTRWVSNRLKLSAQFERISDVLYEASTWIPASEITTGHEKITKKEVLKALSARRYRNMSGQEFFFEYILNNTIRIDTQGEAIGQINGLTVVNSAEHAFGLPSRISARTFVSEEGVINIERLIEMSGPIQQKGAMVLEGFLNAQFAQHFPVSCGCSITFEQNYGGVEGDSASLAELLAILSSLAEAPLRQDIAVTGSIDQFGMVQAVGGIHHKIESFFYLCQKRGFTGTQGVVIPFSNIENLTILDEITEAVEKGVFHIWPVTKIEEAIEILMNKPAGKAGKDLSYSRQTIYGAVAKKLRDYHRILSTRYK